MRWIVLMAFLGWTPVALCGPSPASAGTGYELLQYCGDFRDQLLGRGRSDIDFVNNGWRCVGFLQGIGAVIDELVESDSASSADIGVCPPTNGMPTLGQTALIIVKYLEENPEVLHLPQGSLAIEALREAQPCGLSATGN